MKRGSVENILYIGLDESNHGGNPEICVAIFSTLQKDSRPRTLDFKRKDYNLLSGVDKRDYRFLMLFKNQIKESENKLAIVAPSLIIPYLKSKGLENKGDKEEENDKFKEIRIFLDGRLNRLDANFIKKGLEDYADNVVCRGLIKHKRGRRKITYQQPLIIAYADVLAHHLFFKNSLGELNKDPNIVDFKQ